MRYIAVPVETTSKGVNLDGTPDFIAYVEAYKFVDEGYVSLDVMGHGSTEEEAFADLLVKSGYKEAHPKYPPTIEVEHNGAYMAYNDDVRVCACGSTADEAVAEYYNALAKHIKEFGEEAE
jgi:predicted RNase H-like HicB family nuclease